MPPPGASFGALRYRNFRLFIVGQFVSLCGSWMQLVALGWLALVLWHAPPRRLLRRPPIPEFPALHRRAVRLALRVLDAAGGARVAGAGALQLRVQGRPRHRAGRPAGAPV